VPLYSADEGRNSKDFESIFPLLASLLAGYTMALEKTSYYERFR